MSRSPRPLLRTVLAACAVAACSACGDEKAPAKAPLSGASYDYDGGLHGAERRPGPKPCVILVCLGGVRADAEMPRLARFAAENTSFADASSPAAWSVPSVASLLTGLLPTDHQVIPRADVREERRTLNQAVPTLAEILKAQGYATAAFTEGQPIGDDWGLGQGFEAFRPRFRLESGSLVVAKWLEETRKPFFLFLHAGEDEEIVVSPVENPRIKAVVDPIVATAGQDGGPLPGAGADLLLARYAEPDVYAAAIERLGVRRVLDAVHRWLDVEAPEDPKRDAVFARIRDAYRERVGRLDAALDRFLRTLAKAGLPEDTVVAICSDHGEALGEHGFAGHGRRLYEGQVRVPLAIRAAGRLPRGTVRGAVSLVDVMPTVLDLVGLPPPPECDGSSLLDAKAGLGPERVVAAQEGRLSRGPGGEAAFDLLALRTSRSKYVVTLDARTLTATEEVFDLAADPGEAKPLPASDLGRYGAELASDVEYVRQQIRDSVKNAHDIVGKGYAAGRVIPALRKPK